MARGEEAKARRKAERKEARQKNAENLFDNVTTEDDNEEEIEDSSEEEVIPRKKKSGKRPPNGGEAVGGKKQVIKPLPLILLILLTGTTVLPALIYMSDWVGKAMQKNHVMGSLGYKLGIGSSPRKRVLSFYEKHDPEKISEVPNILAKYYGDYPKLIKRLERKYQDYGYFLNWEQDEAPMVLAMEKLQLTYEYLGQKWQIYAPQFAKTALRVRIKIKSVANVPQIQLTSSSPNRI